MNSRQIKGESYKEIDKLQIGDRVLSANEHTGELSYQPVTELFVHDVKLIHRLTYKEGLTIETTWNHPFWVQDKGWTEAKDLHASERSVTAMSILKGKQPRLQTVSFTSNVQPGFDDPSMLTWDDAQEGTLSVARVEEVHRADKVYNIEVEGNHTYFVTEDGVLVHNYRFDTGEIEKDDTWASIARQTNAIYGTNYNPITIAAMNGFTDKSGLPISIESLKGHSVATPESFKDMQPEDRKKFIDDLPTTQGARQYEASFSFGLPFYTDDTVSAGIGYFVNYAQKGIFAYDERGLFWDLGKTNFNLPLGTLGVGLDATVLPNKSIDQYWTPKSANESSMVTIKGCKIKPCGNIVVDTNTLSIVGGGVGVTGGWPPVSLSSTGNKDTKTDRISKVNKTRFYIAKTPTNIKEVP